MQKRVTCTVEEVEAAMFGLSSPGRCIECGADHDGVEPDAHEYECEECGAMAVYGIEEMLIMGLCE